jgi:hypothetical protein
MIPHSQRKAWTRIAAAIALGLCAAAPAGAASVSDGVASITVHDNFGDVTNYVLGGVDHLFEAEYYFRTASMTSEDALTGANSPYVNNVVANALTNSITVTGATADFDFTMVYSLNGAGLMVPTLDITNTSGSALDITLFNYQDWDVNGSAGGDTITWNGSNILVSDGTTQIGVLPFQTPDAVMATGFPTLRNALRNGAVTTLTDGAGLPFGPGDGTFAFEFALSLVADETASLAYAVPEPSTGVLGIMGLAILAWSSRRRRRAVPPAAASK